MSEPAYRPPALRSMFGGCLLTLIVLVPLVFISNTVKYVGLPFWVLPQALGLIPKVSAADVRSLDLSSSPSTIELPAPGPYLVYSDNYELLELTLLLEQQQALPWLKLTNVETGATVPTEFVARGLMPYDPVVVPGRPILRFVILDAGVFETTHLTRSSAVYVVPDYTTGAETELFLVALLQLAVIVAMVRWLILRRRQARAERVAQLLAPGSVSPKELQRRHREGMGGDEPRDSS